MPESPKPPPPHVVIVGGGLAGLATAAALVDRGLRITLLESRPRLGGRASSFTDPATGELVDNCQHVSMACCTNLADFCRRVGIDAMLRRERELVFLGLRRASLAVPRGPRAGTVPPGRQFLAGQVPQCLPTRCAWLTAWRVWPARAMTGRASRLPTGCCDTGRARARSTCSGQPCSSRP